MSDVVVDSSVWIDFFRGHEVAVRCVDALLVSNRVAVTGPILAEVSSGARTVTAFESLRKRLSALNVLLEPANIWHRVAEVRFQLSRSGVQANIVDLTIALTAHAHGHALLTRDKDFEPIAKVVLLDLHRY